MLLGLTACGEGQPPAPPPKPRAEAKAAPEAKAGPTDESRAELYLQAKERLAALLPEDKDGPRRIVGELGPGLREIADNAGDAPLRANASLLLGTLHERAGDRRTAISFYRQTLALLPNEIEPRRVLALALAADGQFEAAIPEQEAVVKDDPDDLEAWLLLGEVNVKAGRAEGATEAYAAYEMRRRGLIDGLTLQNKDGTYVMPVDQRAACARALIPARDNGTALALLYALQREPDPVVRQALAEAMGSQRLAGYKAALTDAAAKEAHPEAKAAMLWAVQEIERDPLESRPGPAPVEGAPAGDGAPGAGAKGQDAKDIAQGAGAKGQDLKDRAEETGAAGAGTPGAGAGAGSAGAGASQGTPGGAGAPGASDGKPAGAKAEQGAGAPATKR
ncbi:tetratricopeptide repeat protein [Nannocystis exedens]|uniref:tetratricopeptide repeat protein n=1 Tax=Nannocystis exedens TaxID=54 RepID=UPI000C2AB0E2|nr:tetratricopeptide repeat protein [Nannocystis exedens]